MSNLFENLKFNFEQTQGEGLVSNETKDSSVKHVGKDSKRDGNLPSHAPTVLSGARIQSDVSEKEKTRESETSGYKDGEKTPWDEPHMQDTDKIPEVDTLKCFTIPKKKKARKGGCNVMYF